MIQALIPLIGTVLDRVIPDEKAKTEAKMKMLAMAEKGELEREDREFKLVMGQIGINKIEAQSSDPYKSRWRPTIGWICAGGLAYTMILRPLLPWVLTVSGVDGVPALPPLDMATLMGILVPMLGLGAYRTYEKSKGVA